MIFPEKDVLQLVVLRPAVHIGILLGLIHSQLIGLPQYSALVQVCSRFVINKPGRFTCGAEGVLKTSVLLVLSLFCERLLRTTLNQQSLIIKVLQPNRGFFSMLIAW